MVDVHWLGIMFAIFCSFIVWSSSLIIKMTSYLFKEHGMDVLSGDNQGSASVVPVASFKREFEK